MISGHTHSPSHMQPKNVCIFKSLECKIKEHSILVQAMTLKVQLPTFMKPQSNLAMYQSSECEIFIVTLTFHLASAEYSVNSSKFRKMLLGIYLVILMRLYIPQSNRNCQASFSFIVIQRCLCKPKLLALIGENDLLLFSHFHIA